MAYKIYYLIYIFLGEGKNKKRVSSPYNPTLSERREGRERREIEAFYFVSNTTMSTVSVRFDCEHFSKWAFILI